MQWLRWRMINLIRWIGYEKGIFWMSWLRKRWVLFRNQHADIRFEGPVYLGPGFSLHMPHGGTFICGTGVDFRRGFRAEIGHEGRVTIGDGCVFTHEMVIQCSTSIDIGQGALIGQACLIVDGNHHFRDLEKPMLEQGYDFRPLRIDDQAVIHAKSTVFANVGKRAMIGANSVVNRDVPAYTVAVGAPVRFVEYFGPEELRPEWAQDGAGRAAE